MRYSHLLLPVNKSKRRKITRFVKKPSSSMSRDERGILRRTKLKLSCCDDKSYRHGERGARTRAATRSLRLVHQVAAAVCQRRRIGLQLLCIIEMASRACKSFPILQLVKPYRMCRIRRLHGYMLYIAGEEILLSVFRDMVPNVSGGG